MVLDISGKVVAFRAFSKAALLSIHHSTAVIYSLLIAYMWKREGWNRLWMTELISDYAGSLHMTTA